MESIQACACVSHRCIYISLHLTSEQQRVYSCRQNVEKNRKHASVQLNSTNCVQKSFMTAYWQYKVRVKKAVMVQMKYCLKTKSNSIRSGCYIWHRRVDCHLKEVLQQCNLLGMFPPLSWMRSWSLDSWLLVLGEWKAEQHDFTAPSFHHGSSLNRLQF